MDLLCSVCLFLKPWTQGAEDRRKNTAPAEPEQDELCSMTVSHGCRESTKTEDHADALGKALHEGDGSYVCGIEPHVVPGDSHVYEDTDDGEECQNQCLSAVFTACRAAEILSQGEKNNKQKKIEDHDSVVQRMSHTDETPQKVQDKDPHGDGPGIPFPLP